MQFSPLTTLLSATTIAIAATISLPGQAQPSQVQSAKSSPMPTTEAGGAPAEPSEAPTPGAGEVPGVPSEDPMTEPSEDPMTEPGDTSASDAMVEAGVTSVFLDVDALSAVGLELTGTVGEVEEPASESFLVGFNITPETDFAFSDNEEGFTLLGGSIEHTGGVVFNGGTEAELAVGNFSISFDPNRIDETTGATGFFVQDLLTTGAVLFDIAGVIPAFDGENLIIDGDLLVSAELSGALGDPGLLGAAVGTAQINATTGDLSASGSATSNSASALQTEAVGASAHSEQF
ncbi:MAG: hypothetical protein AAFQ89_14095 [Cyanobacteria bacterium J06626_18]